MPDGERPLQQSSRFWLEISAALAALGAVLLAVGIAQREDNASLWNGWSVLGMCLATAAAVAILWSVVLFLALREADKLGPRQVSTVRLGSAPVDGHVARELTLASAAELNESHVKDRAVRVSEIPTIANLVRGKTFENCVLVGPSVIALENCRVMSMALGTPKGGTIESALWEMPEDSAKLGGIVFDGCLFISCNTSNIGIVGTKQVLDVIRKAGRIPATEVSAEVPRPPTLDGGLSVVRLESAEYRRTAHGSKSTDDLQVLYARMKHAFDAGETELGIRAISVWMEARNPSGQVTSKNAGHWLDLSAGEPSPHAEFEATIDVDPGPQEYGLEIAGKFVWEADAYLAGSDAPRLGPGIHIIRASISDRTHRPKPFEWKVTNPGAGKPLTVVEL